MFKKYTYEVTKFLKEGSCSSLIGYLKSAKLIRENKVDEVDVIVSYRILTEDTPPEYHHLIPSFREYVERIEKCGVTVNRILPEYELNEELYEELVKPLSGA